MYFLGLIGGLVVFLVVVGVVFIIGGVGVVVLGFIVGVVIIGFLFGVVGVGLGGNNWFNLFLVSDVCVCVYRRRGIYELF